MHPRQPNQAVVFILRRSYGQAGTMVSTCGASLTDPEIVKAATAWKILTRPGCNSLTAPLATPSSVPLGE